MTPAAVNDSGQRPRAIAIVGPYPPYRGGIAQFTAALHAALKAERHPVTGISFSRQYPDWLFPGASQEVPATTTATGAAAPQPTDSSPPAPPADRLPPAPPAERLLDSLRPWTGVRAARAAEESGARELVFMVWMPFFAPLYLVAARAAQKRGMVTTAVVHNALPHEKQPLARLLMRVLLRRMDRIITLTRGEAARCSRIAGRDERSIDVSPHPVYEHFGAAMDPAAARRTAHWPPEGAFGLLFFGLVRRYKGLDLLVGALGVLHRRRPDLPIHLMVAGEFYEEEDAYRELIAREGLTERVQIRAHYIPDGEVAVLFSAADLVVQPYRQATQSGVVQTAFQFGRPVIVSGVGGLPDMVRDGVDGVVVQPSPSGAGREHQFVDALAHALEYALEPNTLARLARGANDARRLATWPLFARLFADA